MGSRMEEGEGGTKGDTGWVLAGEVGVLASGRATGCDRIGESPALWSLGDSVWGFSRGREGSGKKRSLGDRTVVAAGVGVTWGPCRKGREKPLKNPGYEESAGAPKGLALSQGLLPLDVFPCEA